MARTLIAFLVLVISTATLAHAQAPRTWVSGVGDDANPCSRTAPCKTFAGAYPKTATGGYISVLDPGSFGSVTISKNLTIDGVGQMAGVTASNTNGITVSGLAGTVILRNLSIDGSGTGLNGIRVITPGARVFVENVTIKNFVQNGILMTQNSELFVTDTIIDSVTNQGIYLQAGVGTFNRVTTSQSTIGILAGTSGVAVVKNSVASGNQIGYMAAYAATAQITVEDSLSANNDYAVGAGGGATARVSRSALINNVISALSNDGVSLLVSYGNNTFGGNAADGLFTSTVLLK